MRKILSYVIMIFAVFIAINSDVSAITCNYSNNGITSSFQVDNDGSISRVNILGNINSSDKTMISQTEPIKNWNKAYEAYFLRQPVVSFTGRTYYDQTKACPPYAIVYDRLGKVNFVVSDASHLEQFISFGEEKQGYAVMCLNGQNCDNYVAHSCSSYNSETLCKNSSLFACVWNEEYGYCNTDNLQYVSCANAFDIPKDVPRLTSFFINFLKIIVPIILILTSMITLAKSIISSNEDEMKKALGILKRRLVAAAIVFFIIYIVQFVIMKVADSSETEDISTCLDCFINNKCSNNLYYKTNVGGRYICTTVGGREFECPENK